MKHFGGRVCSLYCHVVQFAEIWVQIADPGTLVIVYPAFVRKESIGVLNKEGNVLRRQTGSIVIRVTMDVAPRFRV